MSDGRCRWSEADDAWLRRLHAERKSDATIAYILSRTKIAVCRRRNKLGLKPVGKAGAPKGFTMPDSARERVGQASRERWADPEYRARNLPNVYAALQKSHDRRFRRPQGPDLTLYRKLRNALGVQQARQEMGLA